MMMNCSPTMRASMPHDHVRRRLPAIAVWIGAVLIASCETSFAAGDAARGAKVYDDCMACHSLAKNAVGPMHHGVFGRKAGSVAGYQYSAALKSSGLVWDDGTLDKWLTDPRALVPGTKMIFKLPNAQDRADVIEFLKSPAAK
jgi:cytochrome c